MGTVCARYEGVSVREEGSGIWEGGGEEQCSNLTRNAVGAVQTGDESEGVAGEDGGLLVGFVPPPSHLGQQFVVSDPRAARDAQLHAQGRPDVSGNL